MSNKRLDSTVFSKLLQYLDRNTHPLTHNTKWKPYSNFQSNSQSQKKKIHHPKQPSYQLPQQVKNRKRFIPLTNFTEHLYHQPYTFFLDKKRKPKIVLRFVHPNRHTRSFQRREHVFQCCMKLHRYLNNFACLWDPL